MCEWEDQGDERILDRKLRSEVQRPAPWYLFQVWDVAMAHYKH